MDNKKLTKIALIILGVFFVLAIIETTIRALVGVGNRISQKQEEKKQEKIAYNSDKQTTQRQITSFLDNIFNAIKDKDYQYVFDSLDEVYKKYMFQNELNQLKTYIEKNINLGEKYDYIRTNQWGGMYQVLVGVTENNNYSSQGYTVKVIDSNTCTFMFGEYTKLQEETAVANYTDIVYRITYSYETPDIMGYRVEIENLSSQEMTVRFADSPRIVLSDGENYQGNIPEHIAVKPNQKETIELLFLKQSGGKSYLEFNVMENNVQRKVSISLVKDIM